MRRYHSALFPYDGSISFDKLGQGLAGFVYFFPNYACCWELVGISFCRPCATWRAGRLAGVILLVWP